MTVRLFGGLAVGTAGILAADFAQRRVTMVFEALAVAGPQGLRRDRICALFWTDRPDDQARASLRQCLTGLRRALERHLPAIHLRSDDLVVRLEAATGEIDLWQFDRLIARGDKASLIEAARLYRGDLLTGEFEDGALADWLAPYRLSSRAKAARLVEQLSEIAEHDEKELVASCEALAGYLLERDPTCEEAHRALIRLHLLAGHPNRAHRQLQQCREALRRDLDVDPETQTVLLLAASNCERSPERPSHRGFETSSRRVSVIVFPFQSLGLETPFKNLGDAMADEVIAALSRAGGLAVIGRNSSFLFRQPAQDAGDIAAQFGAAYAVAGSVRQAGAHVRVVAELIEVATGATAWADRFEADLTDIFALQDNLTTAIVGKLLPNLRASEIERARRKRPDSLEAYDCVMRALPAVWSNTVETTREALELLEQAIRLDPDYALAWALSAWVHMQEVIYLRSRDEAADKVLAEERAERAMSLDRTDPLVLTTLGAARTMAGQLDLASTLVDEALRRDANCAWAWQRSGWICTYRGQSEAAIARFERGLGLSPFDPINFNSHIGIGTAHFASGHYEEAVVSIKLGIQLQPDAYWAHRILAPALAHAGRTEEARISARTLLQRIPAFTLAGHRQRALFQTPYLEKIIEGLELAGVQR